MSQNLISLTLTPEKLATIADLLTRLEEELADLIELSVEERKNLAKMGDRSEAFCRQALIVLDQNRQLLPPGIDVDEAMNDLRTFDALSPISERVNRLGGRIDDTKMAAGSDAMTTSLEGYGVARVLGKGAGLDALRETMAVRLGRRRKSSETSGR